MKNLIAIFLMMPFLLAAQKKNTKPIKATENKASGYLITAEIAGLEDGATIDLLNSSTGAPEAAAVAKDGKFSLSGKSDVPDFKTLMINKKMPYVPIFLDNNNIKIKGSLANFENVEISGSSSHNQYIAYLKMTKPYDDLLAAKQTPQKDMVDRMLGDLEKFVTKNPESYISPLAIYKINQVTEDADRMQRLYQMLTAEVKAGPIGNYLAQQIGESMKNPMGKQMPDFSQADPDGNMISLKSFRGKYVLIDFWASWCGPCRGENPNVVAAFNKFKDKGFTVLGVSLDRDKKKWLDAVAADGLTWPQVSDLQGWGNKVAQQFGISSIPQNFLVDPSGKVIAKNLRGEALDMKLNSIFNN